MHPDVEMVIANQGDNIAESIEKQIKELFIDNYYNYHYLNELLSKERIRFILLDTKNIVIGFASYKINNNYASCSNLLVNKKYRGKGIGKYLDLTRYNHIKQKNLNVYVSCTCDDIKSQSLKQNMGLKACCIKYGYRVSVSKKDHFGSAIIFTDGLINIEDPIDSQIIINHDLKRLSISLRGIEDLELIKNKLYSDYYIEILVGPKSVNIMLQYESYQYCGIDLNIQNGKWYYLFQYKNSRYIKGEISDPKFIIDPKNLLNYINGTNQRLIHYG